MPHLTRLVAPVAIAALVMVGASAATPASASLRQAQGTAQQAQGTAQQAQGTAQQAQGTAGFDRSTHSIDEANSYWVVVNKQRPLADKEYSPKVRRVDVKQVHPASLRPKAAAAVEKMFRAYKKSNGREMQSQSAYRSYSAQVSTYNGWVSRLGRDAADLTSARPGFSEHQTGLSIDISAVGGSCTLRACFASTNQGKWLKKNAWKYGFVLRYPKGKTAITGYEYEPWHYRFVGKALAKELHVTKTATLEEFWGLPAAPTY